MGRPPIGAKAMSGAERQRRYFDRLLKPDARLAAAKAEIAKLKARIAELERDVAKAARARPGKLPR
jgi:hypothetical protein